MASVFAKQKEAFYQRWAVKLRWLDKVLAGVPAGGNALDYWLDAKHMSDDEKAQFMARVKKGEIDGEELEAIKASSSCVFERDPDGFLCLWHNNVKACLRESFTALGLTQLRHRTLKKEDAKTISKEPKCMSGGTNTFQHCVVLKPSMIPFLKDGKPVSRADGTVDRVKHIQDAAGKRSAIGRHEYMEAGTEMHFELAWPRDSVFTLDDIQNALSISEDNGLSASRSQGFGRFEVYDWRQLAGE